jgi:opacity protein-like surface antigen
MSLLAAPASAQIRHSHEGRFYAGFQQGPMLNIYENHFSYRENGKALDLVTYQAGVFAGYDLNDIFGIRLSASYAKNAGACNTRDTAGGGFYPYTFNSINAFADAILDMHGLSDLQTFFRIKLYGGLGFGHSFKMTDPNHPWQRLNDPSTAFGFRFGGIAEYNVSDNIGLFADVCGEAYTDEYNGLIPSVKDQENFEGYGGFPLDIRGLVSLGLLYRF